VPRSAAGQSAEGLELTWATNHLAPFLLTELLLPLLAAAPAGQAAGGAGSDPLLP
jgi:NAD(P)-dependent dehydrogenase (short-subunit alcohol dehydrogenase family)